MPKYTFGRELRTFWYTTIEAESYDVAIDLAHRNFDDFKDIEEGYDSEWDLITKLMDKE